MSTSQIRSARLHAGVGVRELARRLGVSPSAVNNWERSEARGSAQVSTISRALEAVGSSYRATADRAGTAADGGLTREAAISREWHRDIALHLIRDPESVLERARKNLPNIRRRVRGSLATGWVDEWQDLVAERRLGGLVDVLVGQDQRSIDMRQVSPFAGVLSQEERLAAIGRAKQ